MSTPDSITAAAILPLVGGPANVLTVAHCMTRLRLGLRDGGLVDEAGLRALPAVLGLVADGGSYQIVLGPGTVARVTPAFEALLASALSPLAPPGADPATAPATTPGAEPGAEAGAEPATTADRLALRGAELRASRSRRNATPSSCSCGASRTSSCP